MAGNPGFASTPLRGSAIVPSTSTNAMVNIPSSEYSTVVVAGANGAKVEEIRMFGCTTGALVAGRVNVSLLSGTSTYLFDQVMVQPTTPSSVTEVWTTVKTYDNLIMSGGDSLVVSIMETSNGLGITVTALGGNF